MLNFYAFISLVALDSCFVVVVVVVVLLIQLDKYTKQYTCLKEENQPMSYAFGYAAIEDFCMSDSTFSWKCKCANFFWSVFRGGVGELSWFYNLSNERIHMFVHSKCKMYSDELYIIKYRYRQHFSELPAMRRFELSWKDWDECACYIILIIQ